MWLGFVLCWEWVCKGVWRLSLQDYSIIWFMIFLNLFLGVEVMIFGGLVATLVQLARRLASMDVIAYSTTTRTERSNRLYPIGEGSVFEEYGTAVMILHLSNGLLFFGSAFQIKEQVEARLDQEPELMFLLLDLTGIVDAEVSGVKVLQDVMGLGVSNNFQVVFAGLPKTVKAQFKKLGMSRQQIEMAKFFTGLQDALNFVQESLICEFGKVALLNKGTILNPDLIRVQEEVVRICGQESQFLSVAMDVHAWLNHYVKEYESAVFLPQLLSVLTASTYEPGEEIAFAGMKAQDGHLQSFRAPLIWVLQGEVEHIHDPNNVVSVLAHDLRRLEFQSAAVAVGPRPGEVLETARATKGGLCAGPLGTVGSFFNGMHGTSTVVKAMSPKTMVATIQVENLNKLSGDTQFLLRNYCACKRWSHGTLSGRGLLSL